MKKKHTFAICAYKESKYLEECIKSLKKQNIKSKIIMCTSTPNDYIKKIAETNSIELFINSDKCGIGADWNFAVSCANTDLVTIAHQDDIYNENYLEEILKLYAKYNDFSIAFGDYREVKNGRIIEINKNLKIKKFLLKSLINNGNSKRAKKMAIKYGNAICCPSVTINKKILGENPYKTEFKCSLDWHTWYEFSKLENPFAYINKEIMYHRIHEESTTTSLIKNNIRFEEDYKMFCKFWPRVIAKILMHFYKEATKTNK